MKLDKAKAEAALSRLTGRMKKDILATAYGIFTIMNAQMADLIRKFTVQSGFDPRDFSLIAYGGAGPTHVVFYSADIGAKSIYMLPFMR